MCGWCTPVEKRLGESRDGQLDEWLNKLMEKPTGSSMAGSEGKRTRRWAD